MSRLSSALPIGLLAATLVGCVAGPDYVAPAEGDPERFTATPLAHVQSGSPQPSPDDAQGWWVPVGSPRLDATIRLALEHNHDLAAARATLGQVQQLAVASSGALYPGVDLQSSAGRQKYGAAFLGPEALPPFSFYSVGVGVSYLFDFAGGVRRSVEQQRALADYQSHEVDAAALSVSGNVALQALAAAAARARIGSVEALLDDDARDLKLVRDAFDAGSANRVEISAPPNTRSRCWSAAPRPNGPRRISAWVIFCCLPHCRQRCRRNSHTAAPTSRPPKRSCTPQPPPWALRQPISIRRSASPRRPACSRRRCIHCSTPAARRPA
jgi:hypothetical protein